MEPVAPLLAAGGVLGLFAAASALVIQLFRQNSQLGHERDTTIARQERELVAQRADLAELKVKNQKHEAENFACRLQVNGLIKILQQNGLPIPDWLFRTEPSA